MKKYTVLLMLPLLFNSNSILAKQASSLISEAPKNAEVYFVHPKDGQTVSQEFNVVFGLKNMGVAPAGTHRKHTGHHHLLINTTTMPDLTKPLPATDKIKHFGGGQTETTITLSPGTHTLQLLMGNHAHVPHSEPVLSKKITITVK